MMMKGGGRTNLRHLNVKHQTKVTNRLTFAIYSSVDSVDSSTDRYTWWRVGLTNRMDATARAHMWRKPIGLFQFEGITTTIGNDAVSSRARV